MMTYYLREKSGLPSACVALEVKGNALIYAFASWNSKADAKKFDKKYGRELAQRRVSLERVEVTPAGVLLNKKNRQVGCILEAGDKPFRRVLADIVMRHHTYPQRVRDAAKRTLARLNAKDAPPAQ